MPRSTLTVFEGSLKGRVVGTYHHNGLNGLYGPKRGEIIRLEGVDWQIVEGVSLWDEGAIGTMIVQRVDGQGIGPLQDTAPATRRRPRSPRQSSN